MSDKPAPVEEPAGSESGRSQKDGKPPCKQSAHLTGQLAPQPQVPATEESSSTPQAAKASASKKGKKSKEAQPEAEPEWQQEQPEEQPQPRDDSTPRQLLKALGFEQARSGQKSSGFSVRNPPPGYPHTEQVEPQLPAERAEQRPLRADWTQAAPAAEPHPAAEQRAERGAAYRNEHTQHGQAGNDEDADDSRDEADGEDEEEERKPAPKWNKTH